MGAEWVVAGSGATEEAAPLSRRRREQTLSTRRGRQQGGAGWPCPGDVASIGLSQPSCLRLPRPLSPPLQLPKLSEGQKPPQAPLSHPGPSRAIQRPDTAPGTLGSGPHTQHEPLPQHTRRGGRVRMSTRLPGVSAHVVGPALGHQEGRLLSRMSEDLGRTGGDCLRSLSCSQQARAGPRTPQQLRLFG